LVSAYRAGGGGSTGDSLSDNRPIDRSDARHRNKKITSRI